jgi:signal transduction histidine kinase/ABC-type phosphate/phosphonate transport system substrate-binding protein/ActR/RegA family two-component response regulator
VLRPVDILVAPLHGDVRELVRAELLARWLSAQLGRPVLVEEAAGPEALGERLAAAAADAVWALPEQCEGARGSTHAVLRAVRGGRVHGVVALVGRADAPPSLGHLEGLRMAWPAPAGGDGERAVRALLAAAGAPPRPFAREAFLEGHALALEAVLAARADVTCVPVPFAEPAAVEVVLAELVGLQAARLAPFAFTPPAPSDGLCVTRRLPPAEADALVAALLAYRGPPMRAALPGRLEVERFVRDPGGAEPPAALPHAGLRPALPHALEVGADGTCHAAWWREPGDAQGDGTGGPREGGARGGGAAPCRALSELLPPAAAARLLAAVHASLATGHGATLELPLQQDGALRWVEASVGLPPGGPRGRRARRALVLLRDRSEARAQGEDLSHLASFALHPGPLFEVGVEGALRYANPAARRTFPDLFALRLEHPLVRAALAAPGVASEVLHAGRWYHLATTPLSLAGSVRVSCVDVTERRQAQAALLQADRLAAIGTLAAGVGHEINNPLSFVVGNLGYVTEELEALQERLAREAEGGGAEGGAGEGGGHAAETAATLREVLEALRDANQGAERTRSIVRDLQTMARVDGSASAPVDVRDVLESMLQVLAHELRHRARLVREFGPAPRVLANPSRLGQVFLNLVLNAAQAMREGARPEHRLTLRTRTGADGRCVVEVGDTGEGIAPEHLPRIFDPFFTTKPVGTGTGLGLAITHALVRAMGGELEVESRLGEGSTFRVRLPAAGEGQEEAPASPPPPAPAAARARVLVVDDEPVVCATLARMLAEHEVVTAQDGQGALSLLERDPDFDVILCDLQMPGLSGVDVYQRLATRAPQLARRMLFLTGGAFTPRAQEFLAGHPGDWLAKPFDPAQLRARVRERVTASGRPPG